MLKGHDPLLVHAGVTLQPAAAAHGVTATNPNGSAALGAEVTPYFRAMRLCPRAFTISAVKSSGARFVLG